MMIIFIHKVRDIPHVCERVIDNGAIDRDLTCNDYTRFILVCCKDAIVFISLNLAILLFLT